jgi:hypothetical protein
MSKNKMISILLLISLSTIIYSQKINNTNYYDYKVFIGKTDWLRPCDAVPIIIDELLKNDIQYHTIGVGDLLNVNDSTRMILTVSFSYKDKNCGFIYESSHIGLIDIAQRDFMTDSTKCTYYQFKIRNNNTTRKEYTFEEKASLPSNIFLLKETCYWHQTYPDGTNAPVSKKVAIAILRQDIRLYLKKI